MSWRGNGRSLRQSVSSMELGDAVVSVEDIWPDWHTEERLGGGAFGTVWRASSTRFPARCCAIKIIAVLREEEMAALREMGLDEATADAVIEQRAASVLSEIEAMCAVVDAPNVVRIEDYKLVELPERKGYAVGIRMELLESLPARVRRMGGLEPTEVARLGIDICHALEACHENGMIHRDVKPANIFWGKEETGATMVGVPEGIYKLGDFGVARRFERETAQTMSRKGTVPYMAPEVYFGRRYAADVDVYALGIVLYRYLNGGRLPFVTSTSVASDQDGLSEAEHRRLAGEPLPLPSDADEELGRIVCRACSAEPAARYARASELRADLEDWLVRHLSPDDAPTVKVLDDYVEPVANDGAKRLFTRRTVLGAGVVAALGLVAWGVMRFTTAPRDATRRLVSIAAGDYHSVGAYGDGTVVACGANQSGQCEVRAWSGVETVAAGSSHTVGLCSDGSVLACGSDARGQCDVGAWSGVTTVAAGSAHTVGLLQDKTVVACGADESGQCDTAAWSDVVAIAAGSAHTVGLRENGMAVACGDNGLGQCDVDGWSGVTAIAAGANHTLGLCADGAVLVAGGGYFSGLSRLDELQGSVSIATGTWATVGVRADGSVVVLGSLQRSASMADIVAAQDAVLVAVGDGHLVVLRLDGTVIAAGSDTFGQCEVDAW